jgi:hypothetical protein
LWFVTERVLGNLGLPPEARKGYEAYIEGRVLTTLDEACEKTGWCIHAWVMMNNERSSEPPPRWASGCQEQ